MGTWVPSTGADGREGWLGWGGCGLRRGDRLRAGSGTGAANPGVLLRVILPCTRGVVLTTLGADGLLDNDGATLGDSLVLDSFPTLGGCALQCWNNSFMIFIAR